MSKEWLKEMDIKRKKFNDFLAFRDVLLGSDLYAYIFKNGYVFMAQKEVQDLLFENRRLKNGPGYIVKKIMAADARMMGL